jgi:hypothetical protein
MTASIEAGSNRLHGTRVRSSYLARLLTYLMVMGPGLIVMEADNDAGAVATYAQAGGQYGLHLLWVLLILLPVTYFVQEMVVRLGIATGKGHAAMIYQRFGSWWGLFSLCDLHIVNFLTLVTEFAAINEVYSIARAIKGPTAEQFEFRATAATCFRREHCGPRGKDYLSQVTAG